MSSVGQYADGVAAAADGAHAAKDGSTQLVAGAQALLNGANRLVDGTHQLHSGLNQFNEEGISQLTGALDTDQLHALKTVLDAMMGRMEEYTSFSGAPEGAVSSMKFLYKTAENVEPAASVVQQAAPAEADNFFVRLWKKVYRSVPVLIFPNLSQHAKMPRAVHEAFFDSSQRFETDRLIINYPA